MYTASSKKTEELFTKWDGPAFINKGSTDACQIPHSIMETRRVIKYTFHAFLLSISIACFVYHVRGVIEKSLEKKTTLAITQLHFDRLSPPSLTICSGQVINTAKLKKKYNSTYDIFNTSLSYINTTNRPVKSLIS